MEDLQGAVAPLVVTFYAPRQSTGPRSFTARAKVACPHFEQEVHATGADPAQAFFWLPVMVTTYLSEQRRAGYETYWVEKGDLDFADFWTYRPWVGCAAGA